MTEDQFKNRIEGALNDYDAGTLSRAQVYDEIAGTILQLLGQNRDNRQKKVLEWAVSNFTAEVALNPNERAMRLLEEAIELAQAQGIKEEEVRKLVNYVFSRPAGEIEKEIAGLSVTLLAYAQCKGVSADQAEREEIARITSLPPDHWRQRQQAKARMGVAEYKDTTEEGAQKFTQGMTITPTQTALFYAVVRHEDREKNILAVTVHSEQGGKWDEEWNLEHTIAGLNRREYKLS